MEKKKLSAKSVEKMIGKMGGKIPSKKSAPMKDNHKGEMPIGGMDGLYPSEVKKMSAKKVTKKK